MFQLITSLWILSLTSEAIAAPQWNKYQRYLEHPSVDRFREYLRIDTSREENLSRAVEFWARQANETGLPHTVHRPAGKPIFVATLEGSDPSLPSIMLNSHMDVVPVDEASWLYPPFEAFMDEDGDIYARGAQDMKDVGMQYMEALRRIKMENVSLLRTVHITVMPDEETGSKNGMQAFVKTKEFESLNIGFALDEGMPSEDESLFASFVDRRPWQMRFTLHGVGGHGLAMPDNSAMEKATRLIRAITSYREGQKALMRSRRPADYTGYNSVNINTMKAGLAINIIPSTLELGVDMRLSPETDLAEVEALANSWLLEAGPGADLSFIRQENTSAVTAADDSNPYWVTMRRTLDAIGVGVTPVVLPATSDMLYVRRLGLPAIGFSARTRTRARLHSENEYINVATFVKGIDIYTELIKGLANTPPPPPSPNHQEMSLKTTVNKYLIRI